MALKKNPETEAEQVVDTSISSQKAKELFSQDKRTPKGKESFDYVFHRTFLQKRTRGTFLINGFWDGCGIRFSLKEFQRKYDQN